MARRKTKSRRRKFTGINASTALEAVIQSNILSKAATNNSAWDFLTAGTPINTSVDWTGTSVSTLTLKEILKWKDSHSANEGIGPFEVIYDNLSKNWMEAAINSAFVNVGFRLGMKALKRPRAQINRGLRQLGIGDMVRV